MPGIVVGMDESAHARQALDWAMREAGLRQTALAVLTVIPAMASPWTGNPLSVPNADHAIEQARRAVEEAVAKSASDLTGSKPPSVTVNVFTGFPSQALVDASREADLVVVGSRGTGGFGSLMLGSVSSQVAHHGGCPVVIVHSDK
ncbi:MAG TPA: universal stress protein [Streptosporangiaceae bacterium]|nr:universal stress protein [Streptosporangiaceae bacterium]